MGGAVGSGRREILLDSEDECLYVTSRFSVQTVSPFSQRREEPSLAAFFCVQRCDGIRAGEKSPGRVHDLSEWTEW